MLSVLTKWAWLCVMYCMMKSALLIYILWGGVFQLESCEENQAFSRNHLAKIPRKVSLSIRPFRSEFVRSFSIEVGAILTNFLLKDPLAIHFGLHFCFFKHQSSLQ